MIGEAHQEDILQPTHIIIPNTPEAERMVGMMNKNLLAFLWHILIEQGLPEDFITGLLNKSCEATMLAKATKCKWDSNSRTLITEDEMNCEEETRAFEGASWFKDEFGLLAKGSKQKKYATPEALFNLDGGGSVKTTHNHHKKPIVPQGMPPRKQKEKEIVDLVQTSPRKGKRKGRERGSHRFDFQSQQGLRIPTGQHIVIIRGGRGGRLRWQLGRRRRVTLQDIQQGQ